MTRRAFVRLSIEISKPGQLWQGKCEQMGIILQAHDPEELEGALFENITLFLNTLDEHGDSASFFQRNGISLEFDEGEETPNFEEAQTMVTQKDMRILLPVGV